MADKKRLTKRGRQKEVSDAPSVNWVKTNELNNGLTIELTNELTNEIWQTVKNVTDSQKCCRQTKMLQTAKNVADKKWQPKRDRQKETGKK